MVRASGSPFLKGRQGGTTYQTMTKSANHHVQWVSAQRAVPKMAGLMGPVEGHGGSPLGGTYVGGRAEQVKNSFAGAGGGGGGALKPPKIGGGEKGLP